MIKGVSCAHLEPIWLLLFLAASYSKKSCNFWHVFFHSDIIWHLTGKFKLGMAFQWFLKCRKNLLDETFSSNTAYFLILTV